jgi:peptidyl-prolyl cis-trans isomerase A (cyclophilin A)/peptidyl-prolyl cis-trans isomerase B (cyclophilin B)
MKFKSLLIMVFALAAGSAWAANPQVELQTSAGNIKLELYPEAAPKTVENFLAYVKSGFYGDTQFHRVIKGFMVQGGGFTKDFVQKPTQPPIPNEGEKSIKAGIHNVPGTIAMARTSDPNSATAQFFINVADNVRLDAGGPMGAGYCAFGKVIEGMDVVNKIAQAPTGPGGMFPTDVPKERVMILKASVVDAK